MDVVTLGSFILDDIYEFPPVRQPCYGIIGGAGPYAAFGARTFKPAERSKLVGLLLHEGKDFPIAARQQIETLGMHARFIQRADSNTTRGSNVYDADGNRRFAFVVPNVKISASMMDTEMLTSKTYHMICTPSRCIALCSEIKTAREKLLREYSVISAHTPKRPVIVWEPMEDSCHPGALADFLKAMEHVDVFSPNQRELLGLCGLEARSGSGLDVQSVRSACAKLLAGTNQRAIVARCGAHGCLVMQRDRSECLQVPAYHEPFQDPGDPEIMRSPNVIVDVTGGGNAFLGGFCAGVTSGPRIEGFTTYEVAAFYGNVAASYAIEQLSVPQMSIAEGEELWNGTKPFSRLAELVQRVKDKAGTERDS